MKLKIELDLDDLINARHDHHEQPEQSRLPTVPAEYNNEWMSQGTVWHKTYTKGEYRWVRMEGRGESPAECADIIVRMSPGNTDKLIDEEMCYHPKYGTVRYDDYPENMYVQSEKLQQLVGMGYEEGDDNFVELVD